jgi:hypothetical protein
MTQLNELKKKLRPGRVYRRSDLAQWSKAVDRHLGQLVAEGKLQKLSQGLYYYPRTSAFGMTPPDDDVLVRTFLKDDKFLLTSPNAYNSLGVGTTQLYNKRTVYNHKRHGEFKLGNRKFYFHRRYDFPNKLTPEFLLVDLVNNISDLAEDQNEIMKKVADKVQAMDSKKMSRAITAYGNVRTKKLLQPLL